ncbi:CHAT domain-containing protein [Aureispira anguillae]|uniref:CHAT domain-containing protein n=1 Tax=Aureispira anguillae TaxID=2864201 RepID=A0A916DRA7_9BACT|nr:CHAT domain-containing tetratricopeptide repeat protein [Aureispira anguillae]BDS10257.1 CHAT domain-containing protein [Aureispira anguillae]
MRQLFFLVIIGLISNSTFAQKNCTELIYQVADAGWISQSMTLSTPANQDYSIRFVSSLRGLTATITSTNNLSAITKEDYWLFTTEDNERKAFCFIDKTRLVELENQSYYVNTIALNWSGLEWLATHKVVSFTAMGKALKERLIPEVKMPKVGTKSFFNLSKCFYHTIDKTRIVNIETTPLDEEQLKQMKLPPSTKAMSLQFNTIGIDAEQQLDRYRGVDQPNYAKGLSRMAELYQAANDPVKAEQYYLEAQQNILQFSGVDYTDYPSLLNSLAAFYEQVGDVQKAKKHYEDAKVLVERIFGQHHPQYPITLNNLGALHLSVDEFDNSEEYHEQARLLLEEEFSTDHPEYTTTLGHLSNFYLVKKDYKKALEVLMNLSKNLVHQLYSYYPSLNEAERLKFLKKINQTVHQFYSAAIQLLPTIPELSNEVANINLAIKGLALEGSISTRASLLTAGDSLLRNQYYNWLGVRRQLAQAAVIPKLEREMLGINLKELDERALTLESELSAASGALANQFRLRRQQVTVDSIRRGLKAGEAAIDFIHFNYHNGKDWEDSILYYAAVIKKEQKMVQMIPLSDHKKLQDILNINITQHSQSYINSPLTNRELYDMVWARLETELNNVKRVYISPSGLLHQISFGALRNKNNKHLVEQYEILNYGSFRDFFYPTQTQNKNRDIVLVGGAKFSIDSAKLVALVHKMKDSTQAITPADLYAYANTALPLSRALASNFSRGNLFFNYLAGTKEEVETIDTLLKKHQWKTHKYIGEEALEDKVKKHSRKEAPYILHIATHGYFFRPLSPSPVGSKEFYKQIIYAQNPLMRSGLVLTGANRVWQGKRPIEGLDDGILTAYEISNLDLHQTDLVVLSSCETGLGDVYDSEGIFGLQRALKSAGVRQMLVTLWRIPDKETAELMGHFYHYYLKTKSASQALRMAQKKMQKNYTAFYWAGFVLIE